MGQGQLRILIVCTANVGRSPVLERLLARHLAEAGVEAALRSAGTRFQTDRAHPDTVAAAAEVGVDMLDHVPRPLTGSAVRQEGADLVIGMTREHLREVVALDSSAWARTFTLRELGRAAVRVGPAGGDVTRWIARASDGREALDQTTPSVHDDLSDPYGRSRCHHDQMVSEVDDLTRTIARALAG